MSWFFFDYVLHSIQIDPQGRWIIFDITIDSLFFEVIYSKIQSRGDVCDQLIIVGDLNTVLNTKIDRKGNKVSNYHPQALNAILDIMESLDLIDIWRLRNPEATRYTWRRARQASHIDYFLISFSITSTVTRVVIADRFRSDHQLISIHLMLSEIPRGPGYWKFNQSLLNDPNFITKTN